MHYSIQKPYLAKDACPSSTGGHGRRHRPCGSEAELHADVGSHVHGLGRALLGAAGRAVDVPVQPRTAEVQGVIKHS